MVKLCQCFVSVGIPKITGTTELFDAHPAIVASYNVIIQSDQQSQQTEAEEDDEALPPLLFSQFERFLFLIKKYFSLCKVRWGWICGRCGISRNFIRNKLFRFLEIMN